jgi:glycine betaine/proline transport system permease protein
MNWASASVVTNVAKFIMEQGYGCTVSVVPSDTVPAITSVAENGEPDIVTELWLNSTGEVYERLEAEGKVVRAGKVLDPGGVEGWWIPTYLAEAHPELKTIDGILAHPELVGGRFNNCPDGWGCRIVNDNLVRALDLEGAGIEVFNHGSGETLASSMAQLLARARGDEADAPGSVWDLPFPSMDALNEACPAFPQSRELTKGLEEGFLNIKDSLSVVLDPITQPLSWFLDGALYVMLNTPWWLVMPLLLAVVYLVTRSWRLVGFVALSVLLLAFIDHYDYAMQTLAIIFVCAFLCVLLGVPIGIAMSRSDLMQRLTLPVLDMLQTLPPFVYLIPLIFLFSVTESKLYGIAIILYAIVPVIRLTDLGIRLVDKDVIEAADAFGMTPRQKLFKVQIPLALPNIMAGVNQTIMMSLAMVVIASLVSAPGLGVLVLRGIRNLELGVGLVSGLGIVILAVILDRVTKASLNRINAAQKP